MNFNLKIKQILEDFNIFPKVKHVYGSGPNIDNRGSVPTGFKGSNLPGVAPNPGETVLIKIPKKKKKKK